MIRPLRALLLKELRLEVRTRQTIPAMALFALVAMVIFQFAVGFRAGDAEAIAPGVLWATLALTAVLGVGRSFVAERDQGAIEALLVSPVPRPLIIIARVIALALFLAVVEIALVPLVILFFVEGATLADIAWLVPVLVIADIAIGLLGALLAALTVVARGRELLLPLMLLPALLPLVIAGAGATEAVLGVTNDMAEYRGYLLFLTGYAIVFALVAVATYEHVLDD